MKDCTECHGWGYHQEDLDAIKETCETCKGSGQVELTETELAMEHECKLTEGGLRKWL